MALGGIPLNFAWTWLNLITTSVPAMVPGPTKTTCCIGWFEDAVAAACTKIPCVFHWPLAHTGSVLSRQTKTQAPLWVKKHQKNVSFFWDTFRCYVLYWWAGRNLWQTCKCLCPGLKAPIWNMRRSKWIISHVLGGENSKNILQTTTTQSHI